MTKPAIADEKFLRYALREIAQHGRSDGATFIELAHAGLARYKNDDGSGGLALTPKGQALFAAQKKKP